MKPFRTLALLFAIFTLPFLTSCNQDDDADVRPDEELVFIDLGSYNLLPESIEQIPYLGQSKAVFVDSAETEVIFRIEEQDLFQANDVRHFVYSWGPTEVVHYQYDTEIKYLYLENEALEMSLRLRLFAKPYLSDPDEPESEAVADVLEIHLVPADDINELYPVFYHTVDIRSNPLSIISDTIPEIERLGRTFNEVLKTDHLNPASQVYFNFEYGIVSFTDLDGKQWRFEELR